MDDAGEAIVVALAASLDHARLRANVPLAPLTTFRIGGPADALYDATSGDDLANAVTAARRAGIPWMVLGLGANVLVGDRGVRGLVIRNATGGMVFDDASVTVDSGVIVRDLIRASIARDLSGLEHFVRIQYRRRCALAEPALPLACPRTRPNDVHRRCCRVGRSIASQRHTHACSRP